MQIWTPSPDVRDEGEFPVRLNPSRRGEPFAVIELSEDGITGLIIESVAEADRLITAACEAKRLLVAGAAPKPAEPAGPICGQLRPGNISTPCTRPAGHKGGHRNDAADAYWPQDGAE